MKKRILFMIGTIVMLFLVFAVHAADDDQGMDFLMLDWYDVEPWEVQVCTLAFAEEGTESGVMPDSSAGTGDGIFLEAFSAETIVTIQAEKSEVLPDNTTITQLSWYVQPLTSTVNYEVSVKQDNGIKEVVESGSSTVASGYSGHKVWVTGPDINYTTATVHVQEGNVRLEVPIIPIEE